MLSRAQDILFHSHRPTVSRYLPPCGLMYQPGVRQEQLHTLLLSEFSTHSFYWCAGLPWFVCLKVMNEFDQIQRKSYKWNKGRSDQMLGLIQITLWIQECLKGLFTLRRASNLKNRITVVWWRSECFWLTLIPVYSLILRLRVAPASYQLESFPKLTVKIICFYH